MRDENKQNHNKWKFEPSTTVKFNFTYCILYTCSISLSKWIDMDIIKRRIIIIKKRIKTT